MTFRLTIKVDHDAFQDGLMGIELARLLRAVAKQVEPVQAGPVDIHGIRDANGNTCGEWAIKGRS